MNNHKQTAARTLFLLALLLFISSLTTNVQAIGITPGRTTVDFTPGHEQEITFQVLNNEHKDMKVLLRVEGELASYVKLKEVLVDFAATEESKTFTYLVTLPTSFEKAGDHEANIIAQELPKDLNQAGTYIGATAAVATNLLVKVPYPGKYAEIRLDISEAQVNETVTFILPVLNFGTEQINKATGTIEIRGPTNDILATIKTNEASIAPKGRTELTAGWLANVNSGKYYALATLNYDGKLVSTEKIFGVGNLFVEVKSVNVKEFTLGDVAKFNIQVENKWNEKIDNLYAELIVENEKGDPLVSTKSATTSIDALGQATLDVFWDTEGVQSGIYNTRIILHYGEKSSEKQLKIEVTLDKIKTSFVGATAQAISVQEKGIMQNSVLMISVVILIIINIGWFVYMKKKKET
ncbi:MAG: hypothetical protein Q7R96_05960 [Nanoarchaeota archaeon]|nr:hypothetical protein [Nanoarchaeota archaeon]